MKHKYQKLCSATLILPWVPEVFSRVQWTEILRFASAAAITNREAVRKTSGAERFHSLFSLTFDLFYRITFRPMTANISHCDHID